MTSIEQEEENKARIEATIVNSKVAVNITRASLCGNEVSFQCCLTQSNAIIFADAIIKMAEQVGQEHELERPFVTKDFNDAVELTSA